MSLSAKSTFIIIYLGAVITFLEEKILGLTNIHCRSLPFNCMKILKFMQHKAIICITKIKQKFAQLSFSFCKKNFVGLGEQFWTLFTFYRNISV